MYIRNAIKLKLTWHDRYGLESSKHPERSETRQISNLHTDCRITTCYYHKVQPIPWISQVRVLVEYEALRYGLYHHFRRVDRQEDISAMQRKTRDER